VVNSGLILLPGKLAGLLVYIYNTHPLFERGNNGQIVHIIIELLRYIVWCMNEVSNKEFAF